VTAKVLSVRVPRVSNAYEASPPTAAPANVASVHLQKTSGVRRARAATDKASAELVAATEFQLKNHERPRLFIEEVPV
jgi:hypothetical protein